MRNALFLFFSAGREKPVIKRSAALLAIFIFLMSSACGESWSGSVITTTEVPILAPASGKLEKLDITIGEKVFSGNIIGSTAATSVFAEESGTVALVNADVGDYVSDAVLKISPVSKYRIVSSTSDAYSSPETSIIYGGETLYIRCTSDRSHLAIGFTANISDASFDIFTTAGELYIGETVNLYRSPDYTYESKVGVGTVVENDLDSYTCDGYLLSVKVQEGDFVERGQLLFTYASAPSTDILIPEEGIITAISGKEGQTVTQDQILAHLAPPDSICIQFPVAENMVYLLHVNDIMYYIRADDPTDTPRKAVITEISHMADGDSYAVFLRPEEPDLPIGLSVTVVDQTIL